MKKYLINFSWLSLGELISKLSALVIIVIIARKLGVENLGIFNFVLSFVGILAVFADFGSTGIFIREGSKEKKDVKNIFYNFLLLKIIFLIVFIFIVFAVNIFIPLPVKAGKYILLYALFIIFDGFVSFTCGLFRIYEKFHLETIIKSASKILLVTTVIFFTFLINQIDLLKIYNIYIISSLIGLVLSIYFVHSLFIKNTYGRKFSFDLPRIKRYFSESIFLGLSSFLWQIYYRVDIVMLGFMKSDRDVGIYSAAYNIFQVINIFPALVISSVYPRFSNLFALNKKKFKRESFKILKYLVLASLVIAIFGIVFSRSIISVIFGPEYQASIIVLSILFIAFLFLFPAHLFSNSLIIMESTKLVTVITFLSALFNVIANYILIPIYSYNGAAITTLATEFLVFVLCLIFFIKNYKKINN